VFLISGHILNLECKSLALQDQPFVTLILEESQSTSIAIK